MQVKKNKKIIAFTLAEVLITISIVGLVAEVTIPAVVTSIQEKQYKVAYKKSFTSLAQAFLSASSNGNIIPLTGTYSSQGMEANFAAIQAQFNVAKSCTQAYTQKCWANGESFRGGDSDIAGFIDNSGIAWKLRASDANTVIPTILVDTNGAAGPNQYGKDRFNLYLAVPSNSASNGWDILLGSSPIGLPTKVSPGPDINSANQANYANMCPSYATHNCYNTSWLLGAN